MNKELKSLCVTCLLLFAATIARAASPSWAAFDPNSFVINRTNPPGIGSISGGQVTATNVVLGGFIGGQSATNYLTPAGTNTVQQIAAGLISGTVTNAPAPNGVNDSAVLQALCDVGPVVSINLQPSTTYLVTNIYITNIVNWIGNNSIIQELPFGSNCMIDCNRSNSEFSAQGVVFVGNAISNYQASATIPVPLNYPEIFPNVRGASAGSCVGIRWNDGTGGVIKNCGFVGWNNCGLLAYNYFGTTAYTMGTNGIVSDCFANDCYIGFYGNGQFWDGYPPLPAYSGSFSSDAAEYRIWNGLVAKNCGIGMEIPSGNTMVNNCEFMANFVGFASGGGANAGKTQWVNIKANHNNYPFDLGNQPTIIFVDELMCLASVNPGIVHDGEFVQFDNVIWSCTAGDFVQVMLNDNQQPTGISLTGCWLGGGSGLVSLTNLVQVISTNCLAFLNANFDAVGGVDGTLTQGECTITNTTGTGFGTATYAGFNASYLFGTYSNSVALATKTGISFVSTNGAGATISLPIQTNSSGPHGYTLEFTNGLYIGNSQY